MPTRQRRTQRSPAASADDSVLSPPAPITERVAINAKFFDAEVELRQHLPPNTPVKLTRVFEAESREWKVMVQYLRDGQPAILIGSEPLEEFPSEVMIAQLMLVA